MTDSPTTGSAVTQARAVAPLPSAMSKLSMSKLSTTKPGWQTSEFWVHVCLVVGLIATSLATAGGLPPRWVAACATLSSAAYAISRGLTKLFNGN